MEFLFQNKASLLFAVGVVLAIAILMRRWNRYFRRRPSRRDAKAAALSASRTEQPLMDAPPEILRWQVEMHETARDLKAELDTKIAVLERLTIDAREQAARLEELLQRAEHTSAAS